MSCRPSLAALVTIVASAALSSAVQMPLADAARAVSPGNPEHGGAGPDAIGAGIERHATKHKRNRSSKHRCAHRRSSRKHHRRPCVDPKVSNARKTRKPARTLPPSGGTVGTNPYGPVGESNPRAGDDPTVASITPWKTQAAPMAWAGGRIYYNQRAENGVFNGWSANPDGSDPTCVTCGAIYPAGTQHGVSDASPDGQYLLTTIERASHPPFAVGGEMAAPGKGAFNDLWLQAADGSHAWQLTNVLVSGTSALIWPRFDPSGSRVVWSEQWQWGAPFGGWRLHVAELTWVNGVPSLTNERTLQSSGLLEPYGFTADGSKVLFAADALAGTAWDDLQIMTLPASLEGPATRLSPHDASETEPFGDYNEFAFPIPGSGRIIFASSVGAYLESLEYWTVNTDGSDPRQLTWLSVPWSSQYHGYPSLAAALAFDPSDPKRFVAGIETDYHDDFKSLMITLN